MKKGIGVFFLLVLMLFGCKKHPQRQESEVPSSADSHREIRVGYLEYDPAQNYSDDKLSDNKELKRFKKFASNFDEYSFKFIPDKFENILIGVEIGKYDMGLCQYPKISDSKYLMSKESIAFASLGIVSLAEVPDQEDPSQVRNYLYSPDAQNEWLIKKYIIGKDYLLEPVEGRIREAIREQIEENRFDGFICSQPVYEKYFQYQDDFIFSTHALYETYPIFNKSQSDLVEAYDRIFSKSES